MCLHTAQKKKNAWRIECRLNGVLMVARFAVGATSTNDIALTLVCSCKWIGNPAEQHFAKRRKWRGGGERGGVIQWQFYYCALAHTHTQTAGNSMLECWQFFRTTSPPLETDPLESAQGTGVRALCRYRSSKSAAHVSNGCVPIIIPPPCVCCVPSIGRRPDPMHYVPR